MWSLVFLKVVFWARYSLSFILLICGMILENKTILYANDTNLYVEVISPSERTNIANSLNRDLAKIQSWSSTWGMKLNPRKTHSITISQSRTPHLPHPPLTPCGIDLNVSRLIRFIGVTLMINKLLKKHIRNIASSIVQNTCLIRKCYKTLGNNNAVLKSFYAFILYCFDYCSPVCCSASDSHLKF